MLRELADDGRIEQRRKKLHHAGDPAPCRGRRHHGARPRRRTDRRSDRMGRGRARPRRQNPHPIATPRRGRTRSPASATARCCGSKRPATTDEAVRHTGRVIKLIDRGKQRVLGIFRALPGGGGRLVPIDKKQLGRELAIPPGAGADARGRRSRRGRGGGAPERLRAADRARDASGSARSRPSARSA